MALIQNPKYDQTKPITTDNQPYVFDNPNQVINPMTGQTAITTESLQPATPFPLTPPNEVPIYPVSSLNAELPELKMTAPEQEASDLTKMIRELNMESIGESAYRAEQEKAAGLEGLNKIQTDLSGRLKALQSEALAIPLQLQQEATGRGITAGGLAPIQKAHLRENAIQSLSVSSLLEASRGNLTLAMQQVDRAVAQKFDPIREKITALKANLDYILKSPEYSLADKNRAAKQLEIQKKKERDLDRQEENQKTAQAMAAAAVKNYSGDISASMAAQQILGLDPADPQYLQKVFALLGQYQTDPNKTAQDLADLEYKRAQIEATKADTSLTPLKQQQLKAQIQASYASAASSFANAEKTKAETAGLLGATTPEKKATQKKQLDYLYATASKALDLAGASGRSGLRKTAESWFVGSTNYTALSQYADTIKTNLLTMISDPNIRKFFGPQMSEADVRMMVSSASYLNPDAMSPSQMKAELERVQTIFKEASDSSSQGSYQVGQIVEDGGKKYKIINANGDIEEIK